MGDAETFDTAKQWVKELRSFAGEHTRIVLAGNKSDLPSYAVTEGDIKEFAESVKAEVFHTSAKTGDGVEGMFLWLARGTISHANQFIVLSKMKKPKSRGIKVTTVEEGKKKDSCC